MDGLIQEIDLDEIQVAELDECLDVETGFRGHGDVDFVYSILQKEIVDVIYVVIRAIQFSDLTDVIQVEIPHEPIPVVFPGTDLFDEILTEIVNAYDNDPPEVIAFLTIGVHILSSNDTGYSPCKEEDQIWSKQELSVIMDIQESYEWKCQEKVEQETPQEIP